MLFEEHTLMQRFVRYPTVCDKEYICSTGHTRGPQNVSFRWFSSAEEGGGGNHKLLVAGAALKAQVSLSHTRALA